MPKTLKSIIQAIVLITTIILPLEQTPIVQFISNFLRTNLTAKIFSASAIAGLIYGIYFAWQKWLWKFKNPVMVFIGSWLGFENIPVIEGKYEGEARSSWKYDYKKDKYVTIMRADIEIKQKSYQNIKIKIDWYKQNGEFSSHSESDYVRLIKDKEFAETENKWAIIYNYLNIPNRGNPEKDSRTGLPKQKHGGCGMFTGIEQEVKKIEGFYGTTEERKNRGFITVEKVD